MHIEMYLSVLCVSFYPYQRSLLRDVPFPPAKFDHFRGVQTSAKLSERGGLLSYLRDSEFESWSYRSAKRNEGLCGFFSPFHKMPG
jgi:hypothetical protein